MEMDLWCPALSVLTCSHLAFLEALNLALKSPNPPASLEADVMTAEHDDDRPLLEDGAASTVNGLIEVARLLPSERARFRPDLRLARNPNMAGHSCVVWSQLGSLGHHR